MGHYHFLLSFTYIELMDKTTYLNHCIYAYWFYCFYQQTAIFLLMPIKKMKSLFFKTQDGTSNFSYYWP
jgi:hypothetical protein